MVFVGVEARGVAEALEEEEPEEVFFVAGAVVEVRG